ncbi:hypothetical protein KK488_11290 [Sphingobium sp. H33]|uniref:Uncharacterized protein n=1 Tax=Sphingobium nicotianae TaxID=2782607 RepID=A0A9X1DCE0_9SPHN|nr:hypothetical protein [Sphingobium nicotianae]
MPADAHGRAPLAGLRKIDVHVFEEGYIRPDWMTLEQNGVTASPRCGLIPTGSWRKRGVSRPFSTARRSPRVSSAAPATRSATILMSSSIRLFPSTDRISGVRSRLNSWGGRASL